MRKMTKYLMIGAICTAALTGGTYAYLTDYDTATNEFTIGKVDIELTEPHWDPENGKNTVPGEKIKKDPTVTNTGANDAFVYLEVSIPKANIIAANPDGSRKAAALTELFGFTPSSDWTLIKTTEGDTGNVYTYTYNKILKKNEKTTALFDEVQLVSLIEGQLDGQTLNVPVRAYAIQSDYTGDDKESLLDQSKAAFEKYINQNKNTEGKVSE